MTDKEAKNKPSVWQEVYEIIVEHTRKTYSSWQLSYNI